MSATTLWSGTMTNLRAYLFEMAIENGIDEAINTGLYWHKALTQVSDAIGSEVSSGSHALRERAKEIQAAIDRLKELKKQ
jgi:hypothetical protein